MYYSSGYTNSTHPIVLVGGFGCRKSVKFETGYVFCHVLTRPYVDHYK